MEEFAKDWGNLKRRVLVNELSLVAKEELALALFLWKEFKSQGKPDFGIIKQTFQLAEYLGVKEQLDDLTKKFIWPIEIKIKD